jgi:hypothetical protein
LERDDNPWMARLRKGLHHVRGRGDGRRFRHRPDVVHSIGLLAQRDTRECHDLHFGNAGAFGTWPCNGPSLHHGPVPSCVGLAYGRCTVVGTGAARAATAPVFSGLAGNERSMAGWSSDCGPPRSLTRCLAATRHVPRRDHRHPQDRTTERYCQDALRHALPLRPFTYLKPRVITFGIKSRPTGASLTNR